MLINTLVTKSTATEEKNEEKNKRRSKIVTKKDIRSGQAFHYRYIIDLYSIYILYITKRYVYIYIYINKRKWSRWNIVVSCELEYFNCIINHYCI